MKSQVSAALAAIICMGLASCGGGAPKGQVVAKVGKDEVTVLDLQAEMQGFKAPNATVRKAAEQQALNSIIQRKLLAEAARKQKLDKTPDYARQKERLDEVLLVRNWQEQLVKAVPTASLDEAQQFVNQHPDIYAQRKRLSIDGVRFNTPNDPTLAKALQPLNTLDEVRALLTERKIPFGNGAGEIDAFAVDPQFVEQLMKLKPDEVFVVPQGNVVLVGRIAASRVDPVPNAVAIKQASAYLKSTRTRESVGRRFSSIVAQGMKEVKYSKGYGPPAKPAAPPAQKAPPATSPPAAAPAAAAPATPG